MASKTFQEYIIRVRRYLHENNAANSFWSQDMLAQLFNAHYKLRCASLSLAFEGYFTLRATTPIDASVVTNQGRLTWPSNFERLLKMELIRTDGSTFDVKREERRDVGRPMATSGGDSYTPTYRPIEQGFVLEPPPKEISGTLQIEYHGTPNDLVNDGDLLHADFPSTFDELIVLDTAVAATDSERMLESPNGGVSSLVRLRSEMEVLWERYIDRRLESTQNIKPFVGFWADA